MPGVLLLGWGDELMGWVSLGGEMVLRETLGRERACSRGGSLGAAVVAVA